MKHDIQLGGTSFQWELIVIWLKSMVLVMSYENKKNEVEQATRDARYTSTGNVPVYIILQKVRYHNFAQFGISYAAVSKCTCKWQCFPNCCATSKSDNKTTRWIKTDETITSEINKQRETVRSEIWHYFGYKNRWTNWPYYTCMQALI